MMKTVMLFFCLVSGYFAAAQQTSRVKHFNVEKNNLALQGYDVVTYFSLGKAVKGNKNIAVVAEGIYYYFSAQNNKDVFLKNWRAYEPQYGGWSAYAMGKYGEKVEVDPETFKIIEGKLYLFYNASFNNTKKSWNKNEAELKAKANQNWNNLYK